MNNLLDKLNYMTEFSSLNKISQETAIPYSTLWYFKNGERSLPSQYENVLYNKYASMNYNNLRNVGLSTTLASKYRYYAVDNVRDVYNTSLDILTKLTNMQTIKQMSKENMQYNETDYLRIFEELKPKMVEALQNNSKPMDRRIEYYIYGIR